MSNVEVKITADVAELQAKFAVARAESSALTQELNKLARQAATTGMTDELKGQLVQVAEQSLVAKAKVAELSAEMKALQPAAESAGASLGEMAGMAGQLGLALSAASFIGLGKSALEFAANIQRTADTLGLTTDEVQAFQFAARQAGVDTDSADMALRRFMANMGDLQENAGPAVKAVKELGLTADELAGDPFAALQKVASAILGVKDATAQANIERQIFGRGGQELNPILQSLAGGFDDLRAKASDAGQMLAPGVTKSALDAEIALSNLWAKMEGTGARVIVDMIDKGELLVSVLKQAAELDAGRNAGRGATADKPPPTPKPAALPENITLSNEAQEQIKKQETEGEKIFEELQRKKTKVVRDGALERQKIVEDENAASMADAQHELAAMQRVDVENVNDYIEQANRRLSESVAHLDKEYQAHQITAQQKHDAEVTLTQQIGAEALKRLDAEIATLQKGTEVWREETRKRADLATQYDKQIQTANDQLTAEEMQKWTQLGKSIESSFNSSLDQLIFHGESFKAFMGQVAEGVLEAFLHMGEQILENWAETMITSEVQTGSANSNKAESNAAVAATGAASAVASIPYVGPALAIEAASQTLASLQPFVAMASLDVGAWEIPREMNAHLHPGEMVVPQNFASGMRANGGGMGGGLGGGHTFNNTFNNNNGRPWNAEDHAKDIVRVLRNQLRFGVR